MRFAVTAATSMMFGAALILSGCAATKTLSRATFGASSPPVPAAPSGSSGLDWRGVITSVDRDRYQRLDAAWSLALQQARRQTGSGELSSLGDLLKRRVASDGVTPPVGDYRCRTVKLGSQGGEEGLGYVVYGWFACRIEQTARGLKFSKLTGSQRPSGLLFPEDDREMVMLGSIALASEPTANSYGRRPDRDTVAVLERIGPARWRLAAPWPQNESNLDLIELIPN